MSKAIADSKIINKSDSAKFSDILDLRLSRRDSLKCFSLLACPSITGLISCSGVNENKNERQSLLGFSSISGSKDNSLSIAEGYSTQILAPWGEPINSLVTGLSNDYPFSSLDQENSIGQSHDGMHFFPLNNSSIDGILCINHEYLNQETLHQGAKPNSTEIGGYVEATKRELNAIGVSVFRVSLNNDKFELIKDDFYNRRITAMTEMDVTGPVTANYLRTKYTSEAVVRGTLNNCGNGFTPWGTYLTCEEHWPNYFKKVQGRNQADDRLGIYTSTSLYGWEKAAGMTGEVDDQFTRFNCSTIGQSEVEDYRNEANGFGYIVEIDPYDPTSRAVKRTALGRFRHEDCAFGKLTVGRPVVFYSGHDTRFEYVYKFVSAENWNDSDAEPIDRLATGSKYMDEGILYVAQFNESGKGSWLPLTLDSIDKNGNPLSDSFNNLAEIILNTPGAADLLGATPMDRPEWGAVDPISGSVYMTMTNNTERTTNTNPANPRLNNKFGHIIRWDETIDQLSFSWEIFVFGSPGEQANPYNISNLTERNQFASPDCISFDQRGILWILTDNNSEELAEYSNDQILAVVPSELIDSEKNLQAVNSDNQSLLKRFFVGPLGAEITGFAMTPDFKTMFVNIQNPDNWPSSIDIPSGVGLDIPRSSTVVIRKKDGGRIGE